MRELKIGAYTFTVSEDGLRLYASGPTIDPRNNLVYGYADAKDIKKFIAQWVDREIEKRNRDLGALFKLADQIRNFG